MYFPMIMDNNYVNSTNLRRVNNTEINAEQMLSGDGRGKSFVDVDNAQSVINLERKIDDIQGQQNNNKYTIQRQKFQANQLLRAQEILAKFRQTISQAQSASPIETGAFQMNVQRALESLNIVMNDRFNNEATLSGTAVFTDPTTDLSKIACIGIAEADTVDTSYYRGGPTGDVVYVDARTTIDRAEINGTNQCFEEFIRALRLAKSADVGNVQDAGTLAVLQKAGALAESAQVAFGQAMQSAGSAIENIESINNYLDQSALQVADEYREQALTDNMESFEVFSKAKAQLEISRSLVAFQSQETAQFIQRILG